MSFGWSAGDIAAAVTLLIEVVKSLDSANGATKDYRNSIMFLKSLTHTLKLLKTFVEAKLEVSYKDEICDAVDEIKVPVKEYLDLIVKYEDSLGDGAKEGYHRKIGRKLQWSFFESKKAENLQVRIGRHLQLMDTLLQRLTIDMISTAQSGLPDQLRKAFGEVLDDRLNSLSKPDEFRELRVNVLALRGEVSQERQSAIEYHGENKLVISAPNAIECLEENKLVTSATSAILGTIIPASVTSTDLDNSRNHQVSESPGGSEEGLEEIFRLVERLKAYLPQRIATDAKISIDQLRLDGRVNRRLQRWWAEPDSRFLWIQEPPYSKESHTVASVCFAAKQSGIPVVEVSCRRSFDNNGAGVRRLDLFMMVVYSMIYQLTHNALNFRKSKIDISTLTLEALDGTPKSIPLALALIKELVMMNITRQILIISGFHNLEDRTNATLTRYVLELLQIVNPDPLDGQKSNSKTLILTPGRSLALLGAVKQTERLDATIAADKHYLPLTFSLPETKDKERA